MFKFLAVMYSGRSNKFETHPTSGEASPAS